MNSIKKISSPDIQFSGKFLKRARYVIKYSEYFITYRAPCVNVDE